METDVVTCAVVVVEEGARLLQVGHHVDLFGHHRPEAHLLPGNKLQTYTPQEAALESRNVNLNILHTFYHVSHIIIRQIKNFHYILSIFK